MVTREFREEPAQSQTTRSSPEQALAPMDPTSSMHYEPLNQHKDCTRLLKIHPAKTDDDPIICTLSEVAFENRPTFDALSYMWGGGQAQCNIILNGSNFNVRQNLWDALWYLRNYNSNGLYWIDAICINQKDTSERNRQVRMMHHIFFRAETVIVWLGKRYATYEMSDKIGISCDESNTKAVVKELEMRQYSAETLLLELDMQQRQKELARELYNDDYWSRVWIIQEIGHANEIKVCFGNSKVNWHTFISFIEKHSLGYDGPLRLHKCSGSSTLLELLQTHKKCQSQDIKDKVYGLVGLALDGCDFPIDYEKSLMQIWIDTMEFMNQHNLFAKQDIAEIGHLVKFLLMGNECPPLQHISQPALVGEGDLSVTNYNSFQSFNLEALVLGRVIWVGPQAREIVGDLNQANDWTRKVSANYRDDLSCAHKESTRLVRTILNLEEANLSQKCLDCKSFVKWTGSKSDVEWSGQRRSGMAIEPRDVTDQLKVQTKSAEHFITCGPYLFQMLGKNPGKSAYKMGLASSNIRSGDLICWLKWPRRAVIVRSQLEPNTIGPELQVVGTAVITEDLKESHLGHSQQLKRFVKKPWMDIQLDARTIFALLCW